MAARKPSSSRAWQASYSWRVMAEAARAVGICARTSAAAVKQEIAGRTWRRAVLTSVLGFDLEMPGWRLMDMGIAARNAQVRPNHRIECELRQKSSNFVHVGRLDRHAGCRQRPVASPRYRVQLTQRRSHLAMGEGDELAACGHRRL